LSLRTRIVTTDVTKCSPAAILGARMFEDFDILHEPKFWAALACGLAPIVVGIIILWSRR
jgi:hypothetical protein